MKINKLWGLALALLWAGPSFGQQYSTSILYNVGIPVSNTTDYLRTNSFRGLTVTPRIHFNDRFSLGVTAGWNVFYEKRAPDTYAFGEDGNTTLYGTQFRYINAFPLHVSPQVHFGGADARFRPYAGLGLGTTYFVQNTNMGLYAFREKEWLLGLYPEVGVTFPFRDDWHFTVSGKYNHLFGAGELPTQGYVGVNVGLTRFLWGRRY